MFISPKMGEPLPILGTLVHEIVHLVDDCESGHKGDFTKMARRLGLEGKLTATHAGDALLQETLIPLEAELGPFPHAALTPGLGSSGEPKQTTRMLKVRILRCEG